MPTSRQRFLPRRLFAAVSFDDAIGIFEIAFDARTQHFRNQRVGSAYASAPGFVFISWSDPAQCGPDFFVTEALLTGMVQSAMVRENQMRTGTYLYAFGRDFDALVINRSASSKNAFGSITIPLPSTQVLPR